MTVGVTSLAILNRDRAVEALRSGLVGRHCFDRLAINCALVRSCLWAFSGGAKPVHVLRITNLALSATPDINATDASESRDRLREALEELADAGDVLSLPGGRWLPAPLRQVRLGTPADDRLIVGGLPSGLLPPESGWSIVPHGPFRRTKGDALARILELPDEPFRSWVGTPPDDLRGWAQSVLGARLEPYSDSGERGHFRFYAPAASAPRAPQGFRWADKPTGLEGRYYCVRELPFGPRQPRIVQIKRGKIEATAIPEFGTGDPRRLLYALDDLAGNHTEAEIDRRDGKLELTLRSEVPRAERRSFAALGQVSTNSEKYYPRIWTFALSHEAKVLDLLQALRIRAIEKRSGRGRR